MKKFIAFILCISLALGCTACASQTQTPTPDQDAPSANTASPNGTESTKKDTIVIGVENDVVQFDPAMTGDIAQKHYIRQVFDTLVENDADENPVPCLAESWEWSDDSTEITFHLRDDVYFTNGDLMTADDVVFSINRSIEAGMNTVMTDVMEGMEKIDDTTVLLKLKLAYPALSCLMDAAFSVVNKNLVEADPDGYAQNPVGTGAYILKEHIIGDSTIYEANPDYFKGEAPIKNLIMKTISTSSVLIALENGEVDVSLSVDKNDISYIEATEGIEISTTANGNYYALVFNLADEHFSNKLVREAVLYAINKQDILTGAFNDIGQIVDVPIHPIFSDYVPTDLHGVEQNIEYARQLLAEAGYADGFSTTIMTDQESQYKMPAQIIQA